MKMLKNLVSIVLGTIGVILIVMGGHDLFFKGDSTWATGIEGTALVIFFGAGIACLVIVAAIWIIGSARSRFAPSVNAPVKQKREYYGPGSDDFNGAYGDRAGGGSDVSSMVRGAFAGSARVQPTAPSTPAPQVNANTYAAPQAVPVKGNDALDPHAFAASGETPAGAAASMNPLYGGVVETKKPDYVSPLAGQAADVNYDPAYGGGQQGNDQ